MSDPTFTAEVGSIEVTATIRKERGSVTLAFREITAEATYTLKHLGAGGLREFSRFLANVASAMEQNGH